MSKKIIAVDIDEVLAETIKSMLEKQNYTRNGKRVNFDDLTDYNLWEIPNLGLSKNGALWMFVKFQFLSGILKKINPVVGAKEGIFKLKDKGYKFFAVTARLSWLRISTKLRLRKYFPDCFEGIVFADFFTSRARKKSDICKEIGASIIFEDNLDTCIDCMNNGIQCYLFDKPWNQCDTLPVGITRVYSWDDVNL